LDTDAQEIAQSVDFAVLVVRHKYTPLELVASTVWSVLGDQEITFTKKTTHLQRSSKNIDKSRNFVTQSRISCLL